MSVPAPRPAEARLRQIRPARTASVPRPGRHGRLVARVAGLGLVATAALAGPWSPWGATGAAAAPVPQLVPAQQAQSFVDSVGVNTHFSYLDTAYARSDQLLQALQQLGVHHVRDSLVPRPPAPFLRTLQQLPAQGIHVDLVLGVQDQRQQQVLPPFDDAWSTFQAAGLDAVVDGIEAPNEFDMRGGPGWVATLRAYQTQLYTTVHDDPKLQGVPVVGPAAGRFDRVTQLAGFGLADVANLHNYPRGGTPEDGLAGELAAGEATVPGAPLWVTETGFHTATNNTKNQPATTEAAKADYVPRTLLEDFAAGAARTYIYQLVDEKPDPRLTDQEEHFGLIRNDMSRTPAFVALRSLLAATADPGPSFTPAPLAVAVSADPSVQHLLLAKRDGSYALVLWRRGRLAVGGQDVSGSAAVTVTLGGRAREVQVMSTDGGTRALGTPSTVDGVVGNGVVVLQLGRTEGAAAGQTATFDARQLTNDSPAPSAAPATAGTGVPVGGLVAGAVVVLALLAGGGALLWRRRREEPEHELPPGPERPL